MDAHQRLSLRQGQGLTSILLHHMAIKDLETHRTSLGTKQACCLATRPSVKRTTKGRGQSSEIWVYERIQQPTRSFEVAIHCLVTAKDSQGATHHGKRRQGREEKKKAIYISFGSRVRAAPHCILQTQRLTYYILTVEPLPSPNNGERRLSTDRLPPQSCEPPLVALWIWLWTTGESISSRSRQARARPQATRCLSTAVLTHEHTTACTTSTEASS